MHLPLEIRGTTGVMTELSAFSGQRSAGGSSFSPFAPPPLEIRGAQGVMTELLAFSHMIGAELPCERVGSPRRGSPL